MGLDGVVIEIGLLVFRSSIFGSEISPLAIALCLVREVSSVLDVSEVPGDRSRWKFVSSKVKNKMMKLVPHNIAHQYLVGTSVSNHCIRWKDLPGPIASLDRR